MPYTFDGFIYFLDLLSTMYKKKKPFVTIEEIKHLYIAEKLTLQKVADRVGLTRQAVHQRLRKHGIETRKVIPKVIDGSEVKRLYVDLKFSLNEVGQKLGVSAELVARELKSLGIPRRKGSGLPPRTFDKETILKLYVTDGLTQGQVGKKLGVSVNIIRRELERHGITHRNYDWYGRYNSIDTNLVVKMYVDEKLTMKEISKKVGIYHTTISKILKENNVKILKSRSKQNSSPAR